MIITVAHRYARVRSARRASGCAVGRCSRVRWGVVCNELDWSSSINERVQYLTNK